MSRQRKHHCYLRRETRFDRAFSIKSCRSNLLDRSFPIEHSRSFRASTATKMRLAELGAEEKLAILKKKELEIEADLIRKKLAVDLSAIQNDQESLHDETLTHHNQKVDTWLRNNTLTPRMKEREEPKLGTKDGRHLRLNIRERSPTPVKSTRNINALTWRNHQREAMAWHGEAGPT